jgi:hypothetical protein
MPLAPSAGGTAAGAGAGARSATPGVKKHQQQQSRGQPAGEMNGMAAPPAGHTMVPKGISVADLKNMTAMRIAQQQQQQQQVMLQQQHHHQLHHQQQMHMQQQGRMVSMAPVAGGFQRPLPGAQAASRRMGAQEQTPPPPAAQGMAEAVSGGSKTGRSLTVEELKELTKMRLSSSHAAGAGAAPPLYK